MEVTKNDGAHQASNMGIIKQIIGFAMKHRKIMQHYLDVTGVFQAQHHLLMRIYHDQNASQKELAMSMGVSAATIAVSLKKLEKGGYIKKEIDQGDNRFNQIAITEKGNKIVMQSKQIFESADQRVFEGFSEEEKLALYSLLMKLDANLIRMDEEIKSKK